MQLQKNSKLQGNSTKNQSKVLAEIVTLLWILYQTISSGNETVLRYFLVQTFNYPHSLNQSRIKLNEALRKYKLKSFNSKFWALSKQRIL